MDRPVRQPASQLGDDDHGDDHACGAQIAPLV
jgi:hypothetical protein